MVDCKSNSNKIILNNGYLIKLLHEHIPTLQLYGNKKEKKYQWIALYNILKYLDKQLSNIMEDKHELSKKTKKKEYAYNKYFDEYLFLNFNESTYEKEVKPREYFLRIFLENAIIECIKLINEKKDISELFETYEIDISTPKIVPYYKGIEFSSSIFYNKDLQKEEELSLISSPLQSSGAKIKEHYRENNYFKSLETKQVKLTHKSDVKEIYNYTKRQSDKLEKYSDEEVYTFEFKKSRKKIKTTTTERQLNKYINTNVVLDADNLRNIIDMFIKTQKNPFDIFPLINILKNFKNSTNYILYEQSNFRYYTNIKLNNVVNFQAIKKEYRKYIFNGQFDYDINAAAPTLLYQYIKKLLPEKEIKLEYLEKYIKDRNIVRNECVKLLKEQNKSTYKDFKKEVKEVITSALYGSKISNKKSKVAMSKSNRDFLYNNSLEFKNLIDNITELFKLYKSYIDKNHKNDRFINMPNGKIELYENNKRKKLSTTVSGFYFSLESQILLDVIYKNYKEDLSLMIHDGFIARKDIDTKELEELVLKETGFVVKYSKELIKPDL
jgi:hypothetical protein